MGQRCLKTRSGTNADMLKNVQISSDISMRLDKLVGQVAVGALGSWPLLRIESKTASHACSDGKQIKTNGVIISSSSWSSVSRHNACALLIPRILTTIKLKYCSPWFSREDAAEFFGRS